MKPDQLERIKARPEWRLSKVAYCINCGGFVIASLVEYLDVEMEKEFDSALKDGFALIIETCDKTKSRHMGEYNLCKRGQCKPIQLKNLKDPE